MKIWRNVRKWRNEKHQPENIIGVAEKLMKAETVENNEREIISKMKE
jgi:hypothetical protein